MKAQDYQISADKFKFHSVGATIHDQKLETKPVTYLRDAFNRFAKNKGSIVAFFVIVILVLFAVLGPVLSPYTVSYSDKYYELARPKSQLMYKLGIPFWDGGRKKEANAFDLARYLAIEEETGDVLIMSEPKEEVIVMGKNSKTVYTFRLDTYNAVGVQFKLLSDEEYQALQKYQDENNVQIILPLADESLRELPMQDKTDANFWYKTEVVNGKTSIVYDDEGKLIPVYRADDGTDNYTSKMLIEGDQKQYTYAELKQGRWNVRVHYKEYYKFIHDSAGDRYSAASHLFGADQDGRDIFTRLSSGARFSFFLAVIVSSVNLFVGAIYGAIEGYYGGKIDLVMERIIDLLGSIPFMIVITLLKYHFHVSHVIILFISFFLTGWTGMAGRTRMQFYRFKNQEYVLVAKTLGARDRRVMFKHIFPNAIGTLITGSVLVIPGVIFSETSLSYLGIINLSGDKMTSVGTLLSTGQAYLFTDPHMILFPALFISLLELSFNLFGNGLRDAFNPSLRGTE